MTGFFDELGKKLAERWLTALLLPGLLFTGAAGCARLLGHTHAVDQQAINERMEQMTHDLQGRPAAISVMVLSVLLLATGAGIAAQGMSTAVGKAWVARGPGWLINRRRKRAQVILGTGSFRPPTRYLPARVTSIGDRFRMIDERVEAQYHLRVTLVWPRLWLLLDDSSRAVIQTVHVRYAAARTLTGWGVLYLTLGVMWWPVIVPGLAAIAVGWRRGIAAAGALADLIEATVDTHQQALASSLGVYLPHNRITEPEGMQINDILNKRA